MSKSESKLYVDAVNLLIKTSNNISPCDFCQYAKPCLSTQCKNYVSGVGDAEGKYPTMKWSCEDFVFGTCTCLENTPCNGCIQNNNINFLLDETKLARFVNSNTQIEP